MFLSLESEVCDSQWLFALGRKVHKDHIFCNVHLLLSEKERCQTITRQRFLYTLGLRGRKSKGSDSWASFRSGSEIDVKRAIFSYCKTKATPLWQGGILRQPDMHVWLWGTPSSDDLFGRQVRDFFTCASEENRKWQGKKGERVCNRNWEKEKREAWGKTGGGKNLRPYFLIFHQTDTVHWYCTTTENL